MNKLWISATLLGAMLLGAKQAQAVTIESLNNNPTSLYSCVPDNDVISTAYHKLSVQFVLTDPEHSHPVALYHLRPWDGKDHDDLMLGVTNPEDAPFYSEKGRTSNSFIFLEKGIDWTRTSANWNEQDHSDEIGVVVGWNDSYTKAFDKYAIAKGPHGGALAIQSAWDGTLKDNFIYFDHYLVEIVLDDDSAKEKSEAVIILHFTDEKGNELRGTDTVVMSDGDDYDIQNKDVPEFAGYKYIGIFDANGNKVTGSIQGVGNQELNYYYHYEKIN